MIHVEYKVRILLQLFIVCTVLLSIEGTIHSLHGYLHMCEAFIYHTPMEDGVDKLSVSKLIIVR